MSGYCNASNCAGATVTACTACCPSITWTVDYRWYLGSQLSRWEVAAARCVRSRRGMAPRAADVLPVQHDVQHDVDSRVPHHQHPALRAHRVCLPQSARPLQLFRVQRGARARAVSVLVRPVLLSDSRQLCAQHVARPTQRCLHVLYRSDPR